MAERNNINTDIITKRHPGIVHVQAFILMIGDWKTIFPEPQYQWIIVKALNDCVHQNGMTIVGYLITKRRLFLVLEMEGAAIDRMLKICYENVKEAIEKQIEKTKRSRILYARERTIRGKPYTELFTKYDLISDDLIQILTGRRVEVPYSDPHLERLKTRIPKYRFCSAIDYREAEGPVAIKLLKDEQIVIRNVD